MPELHQTYVTQIENQIAGEIPVISMLNLFSPVAADMSKMALIGIQDKVKKATLNTMIQGAFNVNKRQANGVIAFVEGEVGSAEECYKRHADILTVKIKGCDAVIKDIEKRLKKHGDYVRAVEAHNKSFKTGKPKKFTKKPEYDLACPINGAKHGKTYLQMARFKLHQKKRQRRMYADRLAAIVQRGVVVNQGKLGQISFVGSTSETGGNQICQFVPGIVPSLKIRVPYFLEPQFGGYIDLPLGKFNLAGRDAIYQAWASNKAITYVFSQNKHGRWVVAITVKRYFKITSNPRNLGCIGLDINPGSIGWASTNESGNLVARGQVKLDLHSCSTHQTVARLADAVTEITQRALVMNKPIVIEKLDFSDKKKDMPRGKKYRRMLSGFAYAKFVQLLKSRCLKLGIRVIEVSPRYSSQIGVVKYMRRYGLGSDTAAAFVIARRGMGIYVERNPARYALPAEEPVKLSPSPRKHVFAHWVAFRKHYLLVGSRNAWFDASILTGLLGTSNLDTDSPADMVVKRTIKAPKGQATKPFQVRWV